MASCNRRTRYNLRGPATPQSEVRVNPYSDRLRNSVKRNLNVSFGASDEDSSPLKQKRVALPREARRTTRKKYFVNPESQDDDDDNGEILIVKGKRKLQMPVTLHDFVSPIKLCRIQDADMHKTPVKEKLLNVVLYEIQKTPKSGAKTPKTPRMRLIKDGTIAPKVLGRGQNLQNDNTPLKTARTHLHVSHVPESLPCREKEYTDILGFLQGKLFDKCGGCMYISGVPGTGKTATVTSAISYLLEAAKLGDVPEFQFASLNGMKLTEPRQAYVEILKQLTGKTLIWEHAQNTLEDKFTKKTKKMKLPIILLVDELDIICTKRQDVVYNLLDWPTKPSTQLIVITIANTMDLPERLLMNRVTSRLGLTRLTFQAYTHKQLQEIVTRRLIGTRSFNPDAIQLVARKVASVSGDARRALDICRRATEVAEIEGPNTLVTMSHVNTALKAMITQPKVRAIRKCSRLEKYVIQSVTSEVERTGVEETVFCDMFKMLVSLCAINGFSSVTCTTALKAVSRLSACRLLLVDPKSNDLDQRIILNVSPDDVYYALKEE